MTKYALEEGVEASAQSMEQLITDFRASVLSPLLKSAELPTTEWTPGNVRTLVGKNF